MNSEIAATHFEVTWARVKKITGWSTYKQLAGFVDSSTASIAGMKKRGKFNLEWAYKIAKEYGSYTDFIMDGVGPIKRAEAAYQFVEKLQNADSSGERREAFEPKEKRADRSRIKETAVSYIDDMTDTEVAEVIKFLVPHKKEMSIEEEHFRELTKDFTPEAREELRAVLDEQSKKRPGRYDALNYQEVLRPTGT